MLLWTSTNKFLCGHVFSLVLGICIGMKLLGYMVTLFYFFRSCQSFSKQLHYCVFLITVYEVLISLHIQYHMVFLCFDSSNPSGYGVVHICGFRLYFPDDQRYQTSLICLSAICISSREKSLLRSFAHFKLGYLSFNHWPVRTLYIFWIKKPLSNI